MANPEYKVLVDWDDDGNFTGTYDDITADVRGDLRIDRGRSADHGSLSSGTLELSIKNEDSKYSPDNSGGPLFGNLLPFRTIQVQAIYDTVTYYRFTGKIASYKFNPKAEKPEAYLYCEDLLMSLSKIQKTLIVTAGGGKTYDLVVEEILTAAGLTSADWYIDPTDDEIINDATFEETYITDMLAVVAEAAFQFYYMDGQGILNFRHRHWSMGDDSFRTYFTDVTHEETIFKPAEFTYDDREILNDIIVKHPEGDVTDDDATSQGIFGVRTLTVDNLVINASSNTHAQSMASYLVEYYRDIIRVGTAPVISVFPDVLQIEPGKVVTIVDQNLGLDTKFVVMGFLEVLNVANKEHRVEMRLQQWKDLAFLKVLATNQDVSWDIIDSGWDDTQRGMIGQTFKGQAGIINQVLLRMEALQNDSGVPQQKIVVQEYAGGVPTGPILWESEPFLVGPLQDYELAMSLGGLDILKQYAVVIDWATPGFTFPVIAQDALGTFLLSDINIGKVNGSGGTMLSQNFTVTETGKLYQFKVSDLDKVGTPTHNIICVIRDGIDPADPIIATSDAISPDGDATFTFPTSPPTILTIGQRYRAEIKLEVPANESNVNYWDQTRHGSIAYSTTVTEDRAEWFTPQSNWRNNFNFDQEQLFQDSFQSSGWNATNRVYFLVQNFQAQAPGLLSFIEWKSNILSSPAGDFNGIFYTFGNDSSPLGTNMAISDTDVIAAGTNRMNFPQSLWTGGGPPVLIQGEFYAYQLFTGIGQPPTQYRSQVGFNTGGGSIGNYWTRAGGGGGFTKQGFKDLWYKIRIKRRIALDFQVLAVVGQETRVFGGVSTYPDGLRIEKPWDSAWSEDAANDLRFSIKGW